MMRAKLRLALPFILPSAAAFAMGLWFFSLPGCSLMSNLSGPSHGAEMLPPPPEAAAVENSQSQQPTTDRDEDKMLKCEQLVRNPPGIEEIRRTPQLGIESREIRIQRTADSYRWVVYRSRGSAPDGWHTQNNLDKLHFNPALQFLLPDKHHSTSPMHPASRKRPRTASR